MATVKIAMIGVGAISGIYLENITNTFAGIELAGLCDLVPQRAQDAAEKYGVPRVYANLRQALEDDGVDIVLNLTRPFEHFEVTKAALEAGKHVYSEKPLGATLEEGVALAALAEEKGLYLGGAPDTFMGAGIQTCRKLIDDGFIGAPVGAAAFMICHGHESWHPDPEFYYQHGGGPMMDMGPYYVTALVNLMGGVRGVTGVAGAAFPRRIITSAPKRGTVVPVEAPTTVTGILDFACGATGTLYTTFDVWYDQQARFEVYGTKGTLVVPDPNTFGGPVKLLRPEDGAWREMPLLFDYAENSRGLGLADMARAIREKRPARANHRQTLHVLEVLTAFQRSSDAKAYVPLATAYTPGAPMENNPVHGVLD